MTSASGGFFARVTEHQFSSSVTRASPSSFQHVAGLHQAKLRDVLKVLGCTFSHAKVQRFVECLAQRLDLQLSSPLFGVTTVQEQP